MSAKGEAVDTLIARAQNGDQQALDHLLQQWRESVEAAEEHGPQAQGGDAVSVQSLITRTMSKAARQFVRFQGSSEAELTNWLNDLLQRQRAASQEQDKADPTWPGRRDPTLDGDPQRTVAPPSVAAHNASAQAAATPRAEAEGATGPPPASLTADNSTLAAGPAPSASAPDMDTIAPEAGATVAVRPSSAGRVFGDYELLGMIAKGGMGVVYKARQRKLNRIVALKMILAGQFADPAEVERFYVEAEAAGRLRHRNIVSVHEVGEAEGQHYFSMDFVDGQSLADLVRERPLSPRRAAELTQKIAEAVQMAHDNGILHRDLKPSNVLLDENGEPMITDFGLAKRVGGHSHLTMTGTVVGTPSYMPPEQASGKINQIGPESDVYSTGALLYELLTGAPPFRAATPLETLQQVLGNEPPSPRLLNPSVPADMETICLKCLQKEPARRYRSEQALADELGRYLVGEPIQARPVGRLERWQRWCRRNPRLALLSTALAVSLAFAATVFVYKSIQTRVALNRAEASLKQALHSVDRLFVLVSENRLLNEPGAQSLRRELLQNAKTLYEEILAQQADDPRVRHELARSYFLLGKILADIGAPADSLRAYSTARSMQESLTLREPDNPQRLDDLADTYVAMAVAYQRISDFPTAMALYERSLNTRRQLVDLRPEDTEYRRKLANSFMNLALARQDEGDFAQARSDLHKAQDVRIAILETVAKAAPGGAEPESVQRDLAMGYYNLAMLASKQAEDASTAADPARQAEAKSLTDEAIDNHRLAIAAFEKLLEVHPEGLDDQSRLAYCYRQLGNERFWQLESPGPDSPPEAVEQFSAGVKQSLQDYEAALKWIKPLAEQNPQVHEYSVELAAVFSDMALPMLELNPNNNEQALESYRSAVKILEPLVKQYPRTVRYRWNLMNLLVAIGTELSINQHYQEAAEQVERAIEQLDQLLEQDPENADYSQLRDHCRRLLEQWKAAAPP